MNKVKLLVKIFVLVIFLLVGVVKSERNNESKAVPRKLIETDKLSDDNVISSNVPTTPAHTIHVTTNHHATYKPLPLLNSISENNLNNYHDKKATTKLQQSNMKNWNNINKKSYEKMKYETGLNSNQDIANYLKHVQPKNEYFVKPTTEPSLNNLTQSAVSKIQPPPLMEHIQTLRISVLTIVQKVKDFCSYVWNFFNSDTALSTIVHTAQGRGHHKVKKKYRKFLLPLLIAYKLKFFTLVPIIISGLVLLAGSTGAAGFFFALFAAVISLKGGSSSG